MLVKLFNSEALVKENAELNIPKVKDLEDKLFIGQFSKWTISTPKNG